MIVRVHLEETPAQGWRPNWQSKDNVVVSSLSCVQLFVIS